MRQNTRNLFWGAGGIANMVEGDDNSDGGDDFGGPIGKIRFVFINNNNNS